MTSYIARFAAGAFVAATFVSMTAQAAPARIAMSNGLTFPFTTLQTANNIRHYQKLRTVPSDGDAVYSGIQLTYVNFAEIIGGETTNYQPFTLQAEIQYNGVYYPVTFNGQTTVTLTGGTSAVGTVAGLSLPSGAQFYERVRLVGAYTGTQNYLVSHGAQQALLEGPIGGTDASVNILGGKEGHGATCAFNIQTGKIVSADLTSPGVNYTSAGMVTALDPTTQTQVSAGYTSQAGGHMTGITITNGGSNLSDQTKCVVSGGGGFGTTSEIYAAAMITGVPNVEGLESLLIVGDSIARGFGSSDGRGDFFGNYGIYERAMASRVATASTAIPSNTANAYKNPASHKRMYDIVLPYVTHALINLGTNDLAAGATAATLANNNAQIAAELRSAGIKTSFVTVIPRVSGSFATLAGQTPVAGFASGGQADTYNAWLHAGSNNLTSDWGIIDARAVYQDTTQPTKWRVDSVMTSDGIHPNVQTGIPFGAAQLKARMGDMAPPGGDHSSPTTVTSSANNTTFTLAATVKTVTITGTGDTINGGAATGYTVSATAGGNAINTGAGPATLNIAGVYTRISVGAANTTINDQGTYNVIRLPAYGGGVAVITGVIFQKGTKLDLRALMASTTWSGDTTALSKYLSVSLSGGIATLLVTPDGNGGKAYVAAKLNSYPALTLSTVLQYSTVAG